MSHEQTKPTTGPSEEISAPNYAKRRLIALGSAAAFGLGSVGVAVMLNSTTDLHQPELVNIDRIDSDGNALNTHDAAIEAVENEAFKQADELEINDPDERQRIADTAFSATENAIDSEAGGSLVGKKVQVKIVKDFFDRPQVAIIRNK